MATTIGRQGAPAKAGRKLDPDSRYVRCGRTYVDPRDGTRKIDFQPPPLRPDPSDDVVEVLPEEAWRPDLVAGRAYDGRYFLGWVIMRANKLFHVSEVTAGIKLRVPRLSRLKGSLI